MYAVKATGTLRVSREGELEGLDLHEHGMVAYPEYALIAAAAATATSEKTAKAATGFVTAQPAN